MRNIDRENSIDVNTINYSPIATFKQGDNATLELTLFKNGQEFDITGQTVTLGAYRPNNTVVEQIDGFTINRNLLTIQLKNSVLAVYGLIELELNLEDSEGEMTTSSFFIKVNKKVLGEDNLAASDEFNSLKQLKIDLQNAKENEDIRIKNEKDRVAAEITREERNKEISLKCTKMEDDYNKAIANVTNGNENATNSEIVQARGKSVNLGARLDGIDSQLSENANNILFYGGSLDGVTPNDEAFDKAKMVNRKSDYYGYVYFPNNEQGNAVYFFNNTPFLDKTIILADKGVKLSFPSTNGKSFKNVRLNSDITIISRDRDNQGKLLANDYSELINLTVTNNDRTIGLKEPKAPIESDYIFRNYYTDSRSSENGNVGFANAEKSLFKVNNTDQATDIKKISVAELTIEEGYIYNCVLNNLNKEINASSRFGITLSDGNNFLFYSLDINKKLYKGIKNNNVWSETINDALINSTDAYSTKIGVVLSTRCITKNKFDICVNGVLVDTFELPFNVVTIGFGINTVNATGQGIMNSLWGKITYGKCGNINIGRELKAISFGDSITFGEGSISWSEYLPKILEGQYGIKKFIVDNKAVSGNTSTQQLEKMKTVDLNSYDIIMILIGTNDIQGNVSIATFSSNLQQMIDLANVNNKKVIVGIPPMWISREITGVGFESANYDKGAIYRAEIMRLVAKNNVYLADTLSEIGLIKKETVTDILRDNLHPLTNGEIMLSRCFSRTIIESFSKEIESNNNSNEVLSQDLVLTSDYSNLGSGYATAKVKKEGNTVYLEGLIKPNGTPSQGSVITTLDAIYKPKSKIILTVSTNVGIGSLEINPNGNVIASAGLSGISWASISSTYII